LATRLYTNSNYTSHAGTSRSFATNLTVLMDFVNLSPFTFIH